MSQFIYTNGTDQPAMLSLSVNAPATTIIKGGWRMFWLGWWGFIRRRDVSVNLWWQQ